MALELLIEDTENLMNVVVETRKRFGASCTEYAQKYSDLSLKCRNIENTNIRKMNIPTVDIDECMKSFYELEEQLDMDTERSASLKKKMSNTKKIVDQLKDDKFSVIANQPIRASFLLERAKCKKSQSCEDGGHPYYRDDNNKRNNFGWK